jgi:hypothetical protein
MVVVVVEAVSLWMEEAALRPSESLRLLTSRRSRDRLSASTTESERP